ncbi:ABC transporter permease [Anaeromicropila populeti]|nr:ABC transporter permease subunit [Anaeromicropila populeti]
MSKKSKGVKKKRWTRDDTQLALLALPTTIWYVCFCFLPMFGVLMAFKNYRIVEAGRSFFYNLLHSETTGFKNFEFLFSSGSGTRVLKLTLTYNIAFIILGIVVPVILSLMMSQLHGKRYGKTCQTLMFLPYFMSWVIVGYFVYAFLSPDKGLFNTILTMLNKDTVNWYREPEYWPYFLVFLNVWKGMGYGMVVYLASITGIDTSLYEAAMMDGATKFQQAVKITLPLMKSVIIMMFILSIGGLVRSDFGLFYQVPKASNSLYTVTETIDVFIYKMIKEQPNPNMGSAASFLQSVVSCALILITNRIVKWMDKDSAII